MSDQRQCTCGAPPDSIHEPICDLMQPDSPTPAAPAGGECKHDVTTALKDADEFGQLVLTDWDWCATCGAVRRRVNQVAGWSKPANGTKNLPARLNALTADLAAARAEAERLRAALKKFMTLADEEWEDWLFESEGHEYEPEEWSLARIALTGQQEQGGEGR